MELRLNIQLYKKVFPTRTTLHQQHPALPTTRNNAKKKRQDVYERLQNIQSGQF